MTSLQLCLVCGLFSCVWCFSVYVQCVLAEASSDAPPHSAETRSLDKHVELTDFLRSWLATQLDRQPSPGTASRFANGLAAFPRVLEVHLWGVVRARPDLLTVTHLPSLAFYFSLKTFTFS